MIKEALKLSPAILFIQIRIMNLVNNIANSISNYLLEQPIFSTCLNFIPTSENED